MWNKEMIKSHPETALAEIKGLRMALNILSKAVLQYDDADTASQSRRAQKRMLDMANGVKLMELEKGDE
jgi:hypothetical protein